VFSVPGELLGAADIRRLAADLNVRPTKQLGQNFVIDPNTVQRIVRAADVQATDVVLEVGPGLGSLTLALLPEVAELIAVEIDPVLAEALPQTVARFAPDHRERLHVIATDALSLRDVIPAPTALVANLPYNVSVPVLLHLFAVLPSVQHALVMVQREVGERLAASPRTKAYGVPSVKMQWYADVHLAGSISRSVFWPEPKVDSVLVRIERREPPAGSRESTFALIDAAFGQRRKMLRGALHDYASAGRIESALEALGLSPQARGEELTVQDFAGLARLLAGPHTLPS
jgi:16S rRNA (adenine1518-N6/adenine1519-N6)-dimethyltransferase